MGIQDLRNGVVAGRALDNKVGAWVVGEGLRRIDGARLRASVHAVATVQEEIGLRGRGDERIWYRPHWWRLRWT